MFKKSLFRKVFKVFLIDMDMVKEQQLKIWNRDEMLRRFKHHFTYKTARGELEIFHSSDDLEFLTLAEARERNLTRLGPIDNDNDFGVYDIVSRTGYICISQVPSGAMGCVLGEFRNIEGDYPGISEGCRHLYSIFMPLMFLNRLF